MQYGISGKQCHGKAISAEFDEISLARTASIKSFTDSRPVLMVDSLADCADQEEAKAKQRFSDQEVSESDESEENYGNSIDLPCMSLAQARLGYEALKRLVSDNAEHLKPYCEVSKIAAYLDEFSEALMSVRFFGDRKEKTIYSYFRPVPRNALPSDVKPQTEEDDVMIVGSCMPVDVWGKFFCIVN